MRREGINLRATGGDLEGGRPRLLDSKSKRPNNNKITIYSQKYTTLISSQSLPEDTEHIYSTTSTLKSDSKSLNFTDSHPQKMLNSEKYSQSSKQNKNGRELDEGVLRLIREEIAVARQKYETKINELMEVNARSISELRQCLMEQQQKLAEKQHIIFQLMNQRSQTESRSHSLNKHQDSKRLKIGEFLYLQNKVEDLEVKLKIVVETLNTGDQQTAERIGILEQKLIKYNGWKMASYRHCLNQMMTAFCSKIEQLQKQLKQEQKAPIIQPNLNFIKEEVQALKKSMISFSSKEWKYENSQMKELKGILDNLRNSMQGAPSSRNRPNQYYFEEDDDEFFYPHTQRVYQSADDYQHFQADSEEEREKKENKVPNRSFASFKFPN